MEKMEILILKPRNFAEIVKKVVKEINLFSTLRFARVIKSIKQGKVIVLPTDTVYGLIADATNKKAVEKLFKIKKRNSGKPVPIFVKDIKMAKKLAVIDKEQEKFLKGVWPGKVTVVLKRPRLRRGFGGRGKIYGVDKKTIGLRIPKHKLMNTLLEKVNRPLTGTSANLSGRPASVKIKEVLKQFKNQKYQPDLIINAGNLPKSRPSKIVDLTGKKEKILRK